MNSYPQQDVKLFYNNTGISRYPVTFEYDEEDQVVVRSWDSLTNQYTGVLNQGTDYVFDGPTNIVFLIPVPEKFTIFRQTRINQSYGTARYSAFQQGNAIRASDLNGNFELLRNAIQENIGNIGDNDTDLSSLTNRVTQNESDIADLETDVADLQTTKVNSVTGTAPVVSSGGLDPVISMPAASSSQDGYMSAADKRKLDAALDNGDGYIRLTDVPELQTIIPLDADAGLQLPDQTSASGYEVEGAVRYNTTTDRIEVYDTAWSGVAGGADISTTPPAVAAPGDLWWDSEEGRGYVYYDDGGSQQWVESNPSWNGSIPDGSVTPAHLSAGGPSWDTSGNLTVSGTGEFAKVEALGSAVANDQTILTAANYAADSTRLSSFTVWGDGTVRGYGPSTDATQNFTLNCVTGSATFGDWTDIGVGAGVSINRLGIVDCNRAPGEFAFKVYTVGSDALRAGITADGSVSFAGGNFTVATTGQTAITATASAGVSCFSLSGAGNTRNFRINSDGTVGIGGTLEGGGGSTFDPNIELNEDGSASFAGTITTQGGAGGPYVAIGQTITFNTGADNDANYTVTTDVDEEGNTVENRVYNGPTLDVKERLLNLISRLDALEADEIIDDSNSSALLQLVHNLSARLDLRDQQIADLTNRIQTLELNS